MEQADALENLRSRRNLLLNFRWLLFLWLGATQAVLNNQNGSTGPLALVPLALTLASQLVLWRLPLRHLEGLKVYYAVFVFDLMVILMNLETAGRMRQDLAIAFFLGIFVAALSRRVAASFVSALVLGAAYIAVRNHASGVSGLWESGQLLDLPFLLIASIHSGLVAQEAEHETEARQRLLADNGTLTRKLRNHFFEFHRHNQDVKALMDTLPFAMVLLDRSKGIRCFNNTAELVFGIERKCVLGSLLSQDPELAGLNEAVERQEQDPAGGFAWVDVRPPEGDPMRMILASYPVAPMDGAPLGTLYILTPLPYHQSMGDFVNTTPMDDRMPVKEARPAPALNLPVGMATRVELPPLPPLPGGFSLGSLG